MPKTMPKPGDLNDLLEDLIAGANALGASVTVNTVTTLIGPSNSRICKDCDYGDVHWKKGTGHVLYCTHDSARMVNIVSGAEHYLTCSNVRDDSSRCGLHGKYFQEISAHKKAERIAQAIPWYLKTRARLLQIWRTRS